MTAFDALTDEELIASFREGDGRALEQLLERYKNNVRAVAHKFFLLDGDLEDLVQEGMLGLYSAITSFKGEAGFAAYAYACIRNRILDAVKRSSSEKNSVLNGCVSIEESTDRVCIVNPEEQLIFSEDGGEFFERIKRELSALEYKCIAMYTDGATIKDIALSLGKSYKQIDNALSRAKKKLITII